MTYIISTTGERVYWSRATYVVHCIPGVRKRTRMSARVNYSMRASVRARAYRRMT